MRTILIAQPFVAAFYLLMNVSYMSALTYDEMTSGEAVAVIFSKKVLSWFTAVVPLGVAISIFGTTMAIQFAITRYTFTLFPLLHTSYSILYLYMHLYSAFNNIILSDQNHETVQKLPYYRKMKVMLCS